MERLSNVAIVVAAIALSGVLVKRFLLADRSNPAKQVVESTRAPEVVSASQAEETADRGAGRKDAEVVVPTPLKTRVKTTSSTIDDNAQSVSEGQIRRAIKSGQRLVVLDVRERTDYAAKHFPEAKNIPVDEIEVRSINELSPTDLIVLYCGCKNDALSKVAQKILGQQGFKRTTLLHDGTERCDNCR